jgi:DNA-binding XRE family transcriptional regulator
MEDVNKMTMQEHRRRKFMTQDELAAASGVTRDTIWRIENGKYERLRMKTMKALAHALQVEPDDIREFAAEVRK